MTKEEILDYIDECKESFFKLGIKKGQKQELVRVNMICYALLCSLKKDILYGKENKNKIKKHSTKKSK